MTEQKTGEREFADAGFDREWTCFQDWDEWYRCWKEARRYEEGLGLLHALPKRDGRSVRFLMAAMFSLRLQTQRKISRRRDREMDLLQAAVRQLFFVLLKTPKTHEWYAGVPPWIELFREDRYLLGDLFRFLSTTPHRFDDAPRRATAAFLEAWYERELLGCWETFGLDAYPFYSACIEYGVTVRWPGLQNQEGHVETLRLIAMSPDGFGRDPKDIDEAAMYDGVRGTAAGLYLRHAARLRNEKRERVERAAG